MKSLFIFLALASALPLSAQTSDTILCRAVLLMIATIGGTTATVPYSIASPCFAGLYQIAVTVPAGVTGSVPLQLAVGGANSNSVTIPVQ
jgi:uncharacterized protein (TIGR03437 family)